MQLLAQVRLAADRRSPLVARQLVRALATEMGFGISTVQDLGLATSEAMEAAVTCTLRSQGQYCQITVSISEKEFLIEINPLIPVMPRPTNEEALARILAAVLVDEFRFLATGFRLVQYRTPGYSRPDVLRQTRIPRI